MSDITTPGIGMSGLFILQDPFHQVLIPQVSYTCRSLRTLSDIAAAGEQIWERFYQPYNVPIDLYQRDLANNICIVGLQAGTGEWAFVPESFITAIPDPNGITYTPVMLGVYLGAVEDTFSLSSITSEIESLIQATIGVKPQIQGVVVGQSVILSHEEHNRLIAARAALKTSDESDYARAQRLQTQLTEATEKIAQLSEYIKARL
jgi:hypothetical protein